MLSGLCQKVQKVDVIIEMQYPNCNVDDTHKDPAVRHLESRKTVLTVVR